MPRKYVVHRLNGAAETGGFSARDGSSGVVIRDSRLQVGDVFRVIRKFEIIDGAPIEQIRSGIQKERARSVNGEPLPRDTAIGIMQDREPDSALAHGLENLFAGLAGS